MMLAGWAAASGPLRLRVQSPIAINIMIPCQ